MIIKYPFDITIPDDEDVLIIGEFNDWFPEPMTKSFDSYIYEVKVIPGYKYRFQFIVNGEIIIDPNQEYSQSKLGRTTNFKIALDDEELLKQMK